MRMFLPIKQQDLFYTTDWFASDESSEDLWVNSAIALMWREEITLYKRKPTPAREQSTRQAAKSESNGSNVCEVNSVTPAAQKGTVKLARIASITGRSRQRSSSHNSRIGKRLGPSNSNIRKGPGYNGHGDGSNVSDSAALVPASSNSVYSIFSNPYSDLISGKSTSAGLNHPNNERNSDQIQQGTSEFSNVELAAPTQGSNSGSIGFICHEWHSSWCLFPTTTHVGESKYIFQI